MIFSNLPEVVQQSSPNNNNRNNVKLNSDEMLFPEPTNFSNVFLPVIHIFSGTPLVKPHELEKNDDPSFKSTYESLLSTEFGRISSVNDLKATLIKFGYPTVHVHEITLRDYNSVLDSIERQYQVKGGESNRDQYPFIVFNLCDGTESDGYPGISVLSELEKRGIPYTGADSMFYDITTSKPRLKQVLIDKNVPTSQYWEVFKSHFELKSETENEADPKLLIQSSKDTAESSSNNNSSLTIPLKSGEALYITQEMDTVLERAEKLLGFPMIVKPSVSYASMSISRRSIVWSKREAAQQIYNVLCSGNGLGGVFIEKFLAGREFTALVIGDEKQGVKVFTVAERVFNPELKEHERILDFERYWSGYDLEHTEKVDSTQLYSYHPAPEDIQPVLRDLARKAYTALNGSGYGRVDMRSDKLTADPFRAFVLEVNANCGLSFDFSSSLGEILRMSGTKPGLFAHQLVQLGYHRKGKSN